MQLNRIQDQIDRLIVAVGGSPPLPTGSRGSLYDIPDSAPHKAFAIASAPAALAITCGREPEACFCSDDDDIPMSAEVAKLVRKYSTQLRE